MANQTLDEILNLKPTEVARPGLVPGTFRLVIENVEGVSSSQKKTPGVEFTCKVRAVLENVSPEDKIKLGDINLKSEPVQFWLSEKAAYRLADFLKDDLKLKVDGKSFRDLLPLTIGKEFLATYVNEEIVRDDKPTGEYRARLDSTAPVK